MTVYVCTDFHGIWPVGTAAVVVAKNVTEARKMLADQLKIRGLTLDDNAVITPVDRRAPHVIILNDGNY